MTEVRKLIGARFVQMIVELFCAEIIRSTPHPPSFLPPRGGVCVCVCVCVGGGGGGVGGGGGGGGGGFRMHGSKLKRSAFC